MTSQNFQFITDQKNKEIQGHHSVDGYEIGTGLSLIREEEGEEEDEEEEEEEGEEEALRYNAKQNGAHCG